jgi:hypothetical protein
MQRLLASDQTKEALKNLLRINRSIIEVFVREM